jgi:outer membrane biosynthesis protein TonB
VAPPVPEPTTPPAATEAPAPAEPEGEPPDEPREIPEETDSPSRVPPAPADAPTPKAPRTTASPSPPPAPPAPPPISAPAPTDSTTMKTTLKASEIPKIELDEKPEETARPASTAAFDTGAAKSALSAAAAEAATCKQADGPTGDGKVQVTFANNGRVTSATLVEGAFAGTPVGGCIARKFRGARVPEFGGDAVTVAKSFRIPD